MGLLDGRALISTRPFRSPHHTISDAGLIGGGPVPRPGEVSLAHHGVLFLDELPEFRKNVLEVLRQPLEDARITISRVMGTLTFPANRDAGGRDESMPMRLLHRRDRMNAPAAVDDPALSLADLGAAARSHRHPYRGPGGQIQGADREKPMARRRRAFASASTARAQFNSSDSPAMRLYCNAQMGSRELPRHCQIEAAGERLLELAINRLG